ncbi:MAG: hypothetical protein V1838_01030 [Patescibacteria group bacterium]
MKSPLLTSNTWWAFVPKIYLSTPSHEQNMLIDNSSKAVQKNDFLIFFTPYIWLRVT